MTEKILPISYLPEKVNNIIADDSAGTFPLNTIATQSTTYKTLQPIIHEPKIVYINENENISNFNNNNIIENNNNSNIAGNTYQEEYNFNSSRKENINKNFKLNGTNSKINDNFITTQTKY